MKCSLLQLAGRVMFSALLFGIIAAWNATTPTRAQTVGAGVQSALQTDGRVRVIIVLKLPGGTGLTLANRRSAIRQVQSQVLASVKADDFQVSHRYAAVPALAGIITARGLEALLASPAVGRVDLDVPGSGGLAQTVPHIKADVLQNVHGLTGAGVTVAVLDSGIDSDHPDLSGALVGEQCFCSGGGGCCPNRSPIQSGVGAAEDDHGHGTNVTGIITGDGRIAPVAAAPGVNIVAIKVLDANNSFCCSSDVVAGLDWIIANRPDVKAVNMSLGTFATFAGDCDNATAFTMAFANAINMLTNNGVSVFASSGNNFLSQQMAAPACVANTVSVGAVDDSDNVAAFSNSGLTLDLLAPGVQVTAAGIGGRTSIFTGTSQATPHVAGTAALLLEAFPGLTPADILNTLKETGVVRVDPKNGLAHRRIDAEAAFVSLNMRVPLADLALTKTASPSPVTVGNNFSYTITITNNGPNSATNVTVIDNLPADTTFVSCEATDGGVCGGSGHNRTVTFNSLATGESATINLTVQMNCSVADGTIISNTALISSATFDPEQGNNTATVTTTVSNPPELITLQDGNVGDVLQFNALTGDYTLTGCSGLTLSGRGTIIRRGCEVRLLHIRSRLVVTAFANVCQKSGGARVVSQGRLFIISDEDTNNNTCACAAGEP